MRLIREVTEKVNLVTELHEGKGKEYFIEGVFLQSELKNRNGRMYPESVMDKEVARYMKEQVENNRAYGELGHPDTPSINLDRVSHIIVGLRQEGTDWIGKAKILETPMSRLTLSSIPSIFAMINSVLPPPISMIDARSLKS